MGNPGFRKVLPELIKEDRIVTDTIIETALKKREVQKSMSFVERQLFKV